MLLELTQGVALLLALCFLHGVWLRLWQHRPMLGAAMAGLLFGGVCVIGMMHPLRLAPGVIFDARSVVLSMAALFCGPVAALVAAAMAAAERIAVGGAGMAVGLLSIAWSAGAGLLYRRAHQRALVSIGAAQLLVFGLLLHLSMIGLFQWLDAATVARINHSMALPYVLVFTLATAILGWLLADADRRLATERALAGSTARLQAIVGAMPDVVLLIDEQGKYLEVLTADESALAAPSSDLIGRHLHDFLPAQQAAHFLQRFGECIATGTTQRFVYQLQIQGSTRHFEGRCRPLKEHYQGRPAVVFLARDRTEQVLVEEALRESELRFRTLLRDIPSISVQGYRADRSTSYWNKASEQLYGYTEQEALGRNLLDLIVPPEMHEAVRQATDAMFAHGAPIPSGELRLRRKDGTLVDVFSSHTRVDIPGHPPELFCIDIDLTERKAAEEQVRHMAYFDALTGLPNRSLLLDRLQQSLSGSTRTGLCTAVLTVDLDRFEILNDSLGHEAGNVLLRAVAERLQDCVRIQDTAARLESDKFAILLQNLDADRERAAAQVRLVGEKILEQLREPYLLDGREQHLTASLGAATTAVHTCATAQDMLTQADLAMYRAKHDGRNTLRFFDPTMQAMVTERAQLQAAMHQGLREQQFVLHLQPQVNEGGRVIGAEALVRWQHPHKGLVPPGRFIPVAEETGLILPLGRWVLETALRQQARWRTDPLLAQINLSINVSARQFRQEGFVEQVRSLLHTSGADPARITLELTESLLLQDVDGVIVLMRALRALGLSLALDDFGTGYSSLGYLKRLPLNQLKIDQGFVRGVLQDARDATIAHGIISLAQQLGLDVVAEGVETEAHHRFLLAHGCRDFQGYLFGRPEPLEAFEQRVQAQG